ncbi:DUF4097 family beta strand repeat-containing protein [Fodinicola acaciae]|uniref:DUF4097 family beta strand repeat-containing protein n=1 Tax=Fodinicola acaciae TaxID=2681555 RepID=UPI0013D1C6BB|nr:DUF4097 family beta strand repeat-containing protein [Fodinicola acaciae]
MTVTKTESGGRVIWWIAGGVVILIGAVAVAIFGWGLLATQTTNQTKTYLQPITTLRVDGNAASVSVTAGAANQVSSRRVVEATQGWTPTVTEIWSGTTLQVTLRCPSSVFGRKCRIAYAITVPPRTVLDLHTDSGVVTARGLSGKVAVAASSSDVTTFGLSGPLIVRADSGRVSANALRSTNVDVAAESGSVTLGFSAPPASVNVSADSGGVGITVPRTGTSADVYAVQLTIDSGQSSVGVKQGAGARISVRSDSGDVRIDYRH